MTLTPYATGRDWTLYHGDCLEILPTLGAVDAVVTDPPYGMKYVGHSGGGKTIHTKPSDKHVCATVHGDDAPFDPEPFLKWQCAMFGPQWYYERLPPGGSWHSWDKRGDYKRTSFADADFVWVSRRINSQTYRLVWRGLCRHAENHSKIEHPTQKPVSLMGWVLGLVGSARGDTILDPFTGSGTTGVACLKTGRKFIGIEIDEGYCEVAARRLRHAEEDTALFAEHAQQTEAV